MPLIEALLIYRPLGSGESVPLGRTADPRALRVVRAALLKAARGEAAFWRTLDPGVATLRQAEADRLGRVLDTLLPENASGPGLRLVPGNDATGKP